MIAALRGGVSVSGHGVSVTLPRPWEARLYLRQAPVAMPASPEARATPNPAAYGHPGELPHPVLHIANFSLPAGRGDFGSGAVELMRPENIFLTLFEYDRAEATQALFSAHGVPRPKPAEFSANALQRRLSGQGGWQRFFNVAGRAFCLYVVLGSLHQAGAAVPQVHGILDELRIGAS